MVCQSIRWFDFGDHLNGLKYSFISVFTCWWNVQHLWHLLAAEQFCIYVVLLEIKHRKLVINIQLWWLQPCKFTFREYVMCFALVCAVAIRCLQFVWFTIVLNDSGPFDKCEH